MNSQQWELASTHKQPFTVYYGKDEDIDLILARDTDHLAPSLE
jgi:hypothetical protein